MRYTLLARFLHWAMFAAISAQLVLGYQLDVDGGGRGRGRGRGRGEGSGHGRGRGRGGDDDQLLDLLGDDTVLTAHVALGLTILVLVTFRWWWRRHAGLPAWAATLSKAERTLAHWTERVLYLAMFAMPISGLVLLLVTDDAIGAHVATHLIFFVAFALHLGLVLKHQLIDRDQLLRRMW